MLHNSIIEELESEPDNRLSYFLCQATEAQLSNTTDHAARSDLPYCRLIAVAHLECSEEAQPCR
jgi:hypothetical protein